MKAIWNDEIIAESENTVVVEGNHYFPNESVNKKYLVESNKNSFCPWKGTANYFSLKVNGKINDDSAWYYPDPKPAAAEIKGYIAFWRGVKIEKS